MRLPTPTILIACALLMIATAAPRPAAAEPQPPAPAQAAPPKPGPYKPVPIKLPTAIADPTFEQFRNTLLGIAQKKDRAALAGLIAKDFFWYAEDTDVADKTKPGIDNLAQAMALDKPISYGWSELVAYAREPTGMNDPQRAGVICAPGEPSFEDKAADELAEATQTEAADWGYPVKDGVEVRAAASATAPVIEKLGLHLVRFLADDNPANAVNQTHWKVETPSGKTGFVVAAELRPLVTEQMCYVKAADAWMIAGFLGGAQNQ